MSSQATGIEAGLSAEPPKTPLTTIIQLSVMMFLEFAIQGAWLPLLFGYLNEYRLIDQKTVGDILAVGAIGALLSPLVAGQIADRYLNAEWVMAILHFIGAAIMLRLVYSTQVTELYILSFLYGLLYTPTLALVNAISFRHLRDAGRDFGKVRVWGTAGFIFSGIAMGQWLLLRSGGDPAKVLVTMGDAMRLAAILGVALGLYSLTLPRTPPAPGREKFAPVEAVREILRQPLLTLFLLSFVVAAVHSFFFARADQYLSSGRVPVPDTSWLKKIFGARGGGIMTVGQISELVVLGLMPLVIKKVPRKALLAVGLCAYALRFFMFAYLPYQWAVVSALALHGLVFGCFFFLVFVTIDEHTTKDVRSSAQNVFNMIIFGVGVILGNALSGRLGRWVETPAGIDWQRFYAIPGYITLGCLLALLVFYPNRARPIAEKADTAAAP
jgi:nucleoside transporter